MPDKHTWNHRLTLAGLLAMLVGAWGPWVAHANAAMSLGAHDLVEFVKFMQRAGLTQVARESFYLPMLAAAIGLVVWASLPARQAPPHPASTLPDESDRAQRRLDDLKRYGLAAWAGLLTFSVFPPYPYLLTAYRSSEDGPAFWLGVASLGIIAVAALWGPRLPSIASHGLLAGLALVSVALAGWPFARLAGALSALYGAPIQVGWGLILTGVGSLVVAVSTSLKSM